MSTMLQSTWICRRTQQNVWTCEHLTPLCYFCRSDDQALTIVSMVSDFQGRCEGGNRDFKYSTDCRRTNMQRLPKCTFSCHGVRSTREVGDSPAFFESSPNHRAQISAFSILQIIMNSQDFSAILFRKHFSKTLVGTGVACARPGVGCVFALGPLELQK